MMRSWLVPIVGIPLGAVLTATAASAVSVRLETSMGEIELALDEAAAPATVENFLGYVRRGDYAGTIFHRVIPGFMIQGGGYRSDFSAAPTLAPIPNEADNGLQNVRGSIAMARTSDPESATNQFFINVADNDFLDHRGKNPTDWGYCVFGHVTSGMDVVDAIAALPRGGAGPWPEDVPLKTVTIERASVVE